MENLIPIKEVKSRYQDKLLEMEGVISVGVGRNDSEACIVVGVDSESTAKKLHVPKLLEGYVVVVQVVGKMAP